MKIKRPNYVLCIQSESENIDLVVGKVYRVAPPEKNDHAAELRVIDESGEDYLYPSRRFVPIDIPLKARRALAASAVSVV